MKAPIKSIIILLIVIHFAIIANAGINFPPYDSNAIPRNPTVSISLVPLYTLQSGFRVDLDVHIAKNHWLIFGPQYFIAQNKSLDMYVGVDQNVDMHGYGIEIYHKIILKPEESIKGPYAAYGFRYNYFYYKTIPYTNYSKPAIEETNNRYGFNMLFGYQNAFNSKLLIDVYTGCGIQVSNLDPENNIFTENSKSFMNYNYSGPRFILGFRIGLFLN